MANPNQTLLIIFAKEPAPGQVKTRLCPPLSPRAAARLYEQFLADVLEEMAPMPQIRLALAYTPDAARDYFKKIAAPGTGVVAQAGPDLGVRLQQAFLWGFAQGAGTVLVRNSDSPDLPRALVAEAREVLASPPADVVLGPCPDGGYYLVGLRTPQPQLFCDITWSGPGVLADTLAKAHRLGLKVHLLPSWPDIDTFEDVLAFVKSRKTDAAPGGRSFKLAKALVAGL